MTTVLWVLGGVLANFFLGAALLVAFTMSRPAVYEWLMSMPDAIGGVAGKVLFVLMTSLWPVTIAYILWLESRDAE